MAWNVPMTAVAGQVVASADFNTYIRDNLNLTESALSLTPGSMMIVQGLHVVAERLFVTDFTTNSDSNSNTSYGDLATFGPSVTVTTGSRALVAHGSRIGGNSVATASVKQSVAVSGATTVAADDTWACGEVGLGSSGFLYTSRWWLFTGLNSGSNTFTCKYTNSSGTSTIMHRSLHVLAL
jgi:hypothetical protein